MDKESVNSAIESNRQRGRRTLLFLAVVFFGPLAIAALLYETDVWRPAGTTRHGLLLYPPRQLPALQLPAPVGETAAASLRGKWSLLYIATGPCEKTCADGLTVIRQLRRALGQEMSRVQRVLVVSEPTQMPNPDYLRLEQPGLIVLADPALSSALTSAVGEHSDGDIFLADPLGNLVLRYPANSGRKDLFEDLQRLLKASGIG